MLTKDEIPEQLKKFRHKTSNYVKFHEVDAFRVVHNLKYMEWTEVARVEYFKEIGIELNPIATSKKEAPFYSIYLVRTEINYFSPATFGDKYNIYTRVSNIGKTSMILEHIVTKDDDTPLCIHQAVQVFVDKEQKPVNIADPIKEAIFNYENPLIN